MSRRAQADADADAVPDVFAGMTLKERRFTEAYLGAAAGNATKAARLAGYKGNLLTLGVVGSENLRKPRIREAFALLLEQDELVAGRTERLRFMSRVMRGEERDQRVTADGEVIEVRTPMHLRLRAAEKLAEIGGDFREPEKTADSLPPDLSVSQLFDLAGIPQTPGAEPTVSN
jgi:phage terminase small subunit